MMDDLIGVFIELHPQFHLDRQASLHIPGLGITLIFAIQCPAVPRPPFEPEDVPQENDLRHRLGIHIGGRVAVIEDGLLIITQNHVEISAARRHGGNLDGLRRDGLVRP
jgi:hypothetical protein